MRGYNSIDKQPIFSLPHSYSDSARPDLIGSFKRGYILSSRLLFFQVGAATHGFRMFQSLEPPVNTEVFLKMNSPWQALDCSIVRMRVFVCARMLAKNSWMRSHKKCKSQSLMHFLLNLDPFHAVMYGNDGWTKYSRLIALRPLHAWWCIYKDVYSFPMKTPI